MVICVHGLQIMLMTKKLQLRIQSWCSKESKEESARYCKANCIRSVDYGELVGSGLGLSIYEANFLLKIADVTTESVKRTMQIADVYTLNMLSD